jgi:hypothetical protein
LGLPAINTAADFESSRAPTSLGTGTHLNPKSEFPSIDNNDTVFGSKK